MKDMKQQPHADGWAVFDLQTGRWAVACDECGDELEPVWLPALKGWGAWQDGKPIVLVQLRADELGRGTDCDMCPSHGRRAMWDGERWLGPGRQHDQGREGGVERVAKVVDLSRSLDQQVSL